MSQVNQGAEQVQEDELSYIESPQYNEIVFDPRLERQLPPRPMDRELPPFPNTPPESFTNFSWSKYVQEPETPKHTPEDIEKYRSQMTPSPPKRFIDRIRKGPLKPKLPVRPDGRQEIMADIEAELFGKRRYPDPRTLDRWSFHHPLRDDPSFPPMDLLNFNLADSFDRDKNPVLVAKSRTPSPASIHEEMRVLKREAEWDKEDRERAARGEPPVDRLQAVRREEKKLRVLARSDRYMLMPNPGTEVYHYRYANDPEGLVYGDVSPGPSSFEIPLSPDSFKETGPSNPIQRPIKKLGRLLSRRGRVEQDRHSHHAWEDPTGEGRREFTLEPFMDFQASVRGSVISTRPRPRVRTPSPRLHEQFEMPEQWETKEEKLRRRNARLAREGKVLVERPPPDKRVYNFHRDTEENVYDAVRRSEFPRIVDLRRPEERVQPDPLFNLRMPQDHPLYEDFQAFHRDREEDIQEAMKALEERERRRLTKPSRLPWWNVWGGVRNFPRWGRRHEEASPQDDIGQMSAAATQAAPAPAAEARAPSSPSHESSRSTVRVSTGMPEPIAARDSQYRYEDPSLEPPFPVNPDDHQRIVSSDTETLTEHSPIPPGMRNTLLTPQHVQSPSYAPAPEAGPSKFPGSYPVKAPPAAEPPLKSQRNTLLESPPPLTSALSSPSLDDGRPLKQVSRPATPESPPRGGFQYAATARSSSSGFDRSLSTTSLPPVRFTPLTTHINEFLDVMKRVQAMPWMSDRPTVDYIPREDPQATWRRAVEEHLTLDWIAADDDREKKSWYEPGDGGILGRIFSQRRGRRDVVIEQPQEDESAESATYSAPPSVRLVPPPSPTEMDYYEPSNAGDGMIAIPVHTANGGVRRLVISAGAPRTLSRNALSAQLMSPRTDRTGPSRRASRTGVPQPVESARVSQIYSPRTAPSHRSSRHIQTQTPGVFITPSTPPYQDTPPATSRPQTQRIRSRPNSSKYPRTPHPWDNRQIYPSPSDTRSPRSGAAGGSQYLSPEGFTPARLPTRLRPRSRSPSPSTDRSQSPVFPRRAPAPTDGQAGLPPRTIIPPIAAVTSPSQARSRGRTAYQPSLSSSSPSIGFPPAVPARPFVQSSSGESQLLSPRPGRPNVPRPRERPPPQEPPVYPSSTFVFGPRSN